MTMSQETQVANMLAESATPALPAINLPLSPVDMQNLSPQAMALALRGLLEAGVHFGHQTKRWNPKMKPYIFTQRNGVHIIDLQQTVTGLAYACEFMTDVAAQGGKVLFVGTKKQAQEVLKEEAARAGQFYVNKRWPGGLLTNFVTIRQRLAHLADLENRRDKGEFEGLPKKETNHLNDEIGTLNDVLGGIKGMTYLPTVMFVVDTHRERIAMQEAARLEIPVVALADTNSDPDEINYVIPGNDDAIRAVRMITARIADAIIEGVNRRAAARTDMAALMAEQQAAGRS